MATAKKGAKKGLTAGEELVGDMAALEVVVSQAKAEVNRFVNDGVKACATRARKALQDAKVITQRMRKLITEIKNEM